MSGKGSGCETHKESIKSFFKKTKTLEMILVDLEVFVCLFACLSVEMVRDAVKEVVVEFSGYEH